MKRAVAAFGLVLLLAGCGGVIPAATPPRPDSVDSRIAQASDQFGIALLQAVAAAQPDENLFLSPTSAQVVLSLTANGARGETQQEMLAALGYGELALAEVNEANQALRGLLADPDPKVQLSIANAVWYQKGMKVAPAFREVASQQYGVQVNETTFGDPKAAQAINRWVSDQTRGRIPQLLNETSPQEVMVLVNALYFKGEWEEPFTSDLTRQRPFHKLDGSEKPVAFMHRTASFGYVAEEGLVGVRLPYGEGDLSLYAFMPDRWEGFLEELTPERYQGWIAAVEQERIRLALPKVKLEAGAMLNLPLQALGMVQAFNSTQADLSGLFTTSDGVFISQVIQKTFLEINEKGTEAAAATAVRTNGGAAPAEPVEVVLDHPFLLAIRDDRTGVTLFMGAILEP